MNSRIPDDYRIPDDPDTGRMDAAYLRSCLGLRAKPGEDPPELPLAVRRAHYDMARSLSILGAMGNGMNPTQLATVVALALRDGIETTDEEPAYSFLDAVEAGRVAHGQKVVIKWRMKDRAAHFLHATDDRVVVLYDGNECNIRPDLVRFAGEDEFSEVADNFSVTGADQGRPGGQVPATSGVANGTQVAPAGRHGWDDFS